MTERRTDTLTAFGEQYLLATDALGGSMYALDYETGAYDFFGGNIEKLTGYTADELTQPVFVSRVRKVHVFGGMNEIPSEERLRRIHAGELPVIRGDYLFEARDGQLRWLSDASVQRKDSDGKPVGSVGMLLDVTERKRAEARAEAFASLGARLGAADSALDAARAVADIARLLFNYEACHVSLYNPSTGFLTGLLSQDTTTEGALISTELPYRFVKPSELTRTILFGQSRLILRNREHPTDGASQLDAFGDKQRLSASLMFAPIRGDGKPHGYITFQSYRPDAYTDDDLADLQGLADHCAAGLRRAHVFEELERSEARFRTVWESAPSGLRLADASGTTVLVNPAFCRLVELPREQLEGNPISIYRWIQERDVALERFTSRFLAGTVEREMDLNVRLWNGKELSLHVTNAMLVDSEEPLLLSVVQDLTAQKQLETALKLYAAEMETMAVTDSLTGLYNRRGLTERLKRSAIRARRHETPLSLMLFDLDHFKQVNDRYGHAGGDEVLRGMGDLVRAFARESDVASRYGGEEFALMLDGADLVGARIAAERLRQCVDENEFACTGHPAIRLTCSIGIAQLMAEEETDSLLNRADKALYRAKAAGRNCVCE